MAENPNRLHRTIDTPSGPVEYAINRRGCKGPWTAEDDAAMAELVRAALAHVAKPSVARPPQETNQP